LAEERGSPLADQALYWLGRTKELMKRPKEAIRIYQGLLQSPQSDYYQLRAREALLRLTGGRLTIDQRRETRDERLETKAFTPPKETPPLAKARELFELRLKKEAVEEYWELALASPDDLGLLKEALNTFTEAGRFDKALWMAKKILKPLYHQRPKAEPIPGFWSYLFPLGYFPLIKSEASTVDLDPYLVLAVIREESAFQKDAVSWAGARGLMQLLPQTAELMAKEMKLAKPPLDGLDSPPLNIALGTRYLSHLLQEFSGDLALALAAYNAGPHQVRRWLEKYGSASPEVFIEEIPFPETSNYVKRVLGSYDRYLTLYGGSR
ncbi:MAG: transglycosylase SLT domain-containing protein, partial [Candidatus Methylomirabilales bacterium]